MSTEQHIPCENFTEIYTNPAGGGDVTLRLSIDGACGGETVLGLYEIGTNIRKSIPPFNPGLNTVKVPANQYLAAYCGGQKSTECIARYDVL